MRHLIGPAWESVGVSTANYYGLGGIHPDTLRLANAGFFNYVDEYSWHFYDLYYYDQNATIDGDNSYDGGRVSFIKNLDVINQYLAGKPFHINEFGFYGQSAFGQPYASEGGGVGGPPSRDRPWHSGMVQAIKAVVATEGGRYC